MVSKSYIVNGCPDIFDDDDGKCVEGSAKKQQISDQEIRDKQMSRVDRYILDMVKIKPSKIFHADKSTSNYWSNKNIIKWNNRECPWKNGPNLGTRSLVKLVIFSLLFIAFGFFIFTWLHPSSSPTPQSPIVQDHTVIVKLNTNLSITDSPPMTEESAKISSAVQKTSTLPSTNVISHDGYGEAEKSGDDALLTKKYVVNFYTTSNKNLFSVKVSPTLPSINKQEPTSELPIQNYANDNSCQSTSLPLCQGVLAYDLTDPRAKWNLTNVEYSHFQHLLFSNCSKRVPEFVCSSLEPECRPSRMINLKPCRRICKGIFEACSHIIASSEVLTQFFDCNTYIDSSDHLLCEDITRTTKTCFPDEFQCGDSTCIPSKWRCDNIRDCPGGEDERDCKFCNFDEFKCVSDQQCISEKWYCDGVEDCFDKSDESDCDITSEEVTEDSDRSILYYDDKDYPQANFEQDHNDSDGDRIVSTGSDIVVPIIVNPNATSSSSPQPPTTIKSTKRFRSATRKPATTQQPPEEEMTAETTTTATQQKHEIVKASTSHSSPCPEFELRCVDGLCITLDQICDKIQDCSDNADELHCEYDN